MSNYHSFIIRKKMTRGSVYVSKYNISMVFYGTILDAKHFVSKEEADETAKKIVGGNVLVLKCTLTVCETPNGA